MEVKQEVTSQGQKQISSSEVIEALRREVENLKIEGKVSGYKSSEGNEEFPPPDEESS